MRKIEVLFFFFEFGLESLSILSSFLSLVLCHIIFT